MDIPFVTCNNHCKYYFIQLGEDLSHTTDAGLPGFGTGIIFFQKIKGILNKYVW